MDIERDLEAPDVRRVFLHEASHAVMAMAFGRRVVSVEIDAKAFRGQTSIEEIPNDSDLNRVRLILLAAAGLAAESIYCHATGTAEKSFSIGHFKDENDAAPPLTTLGHAGYFMEYVKIASVILSDHTYWVPMNFLADLLPEKGFFTNQEILQKISKHVPPISEELLQGILNGLPRNSPHSGRKFIV